MIGIIILANLAVVLAFLAGATADLAPLLRRSERRSRLFTVVAILALAMLVHLVVRN